MLPTVAKVKNVNILGCFFLKKIRVSHDIFVQHVQLKALDEDEQRLIIQARAQACNNSATKCGVNSSTTKMLHVLHVDTIGGARSNHNMAD